MKKTPTDGHLLLERVEIHFASGWSKVTRVSIKPEGWWTKVWTAPDAASTGVGTRMDAGGGSREVAAKTDNKKVQGNQDVEGVSLKSDPRKAEGFLAWLLLVIGAGKNGMLEGQDVLDGDPANTLYSVNNNKVYADQFLSFERDKDDSQSNRVLPPGVCSFPKDKIKKRVILGSFESSGRPNCSPPVTYKLRAKFDLRVFKDGASSQDYAGAEQALLKMYRACRAKTVRGAAVGSKPNNLHEVFCSGFFGRPALDRELEAALSCGKPIIWVFGEDGCGKAEAVKGLLSKRLDELPYEGIVWIDVRPANTVQALGLVEILSKVGRELGIAKLMSTDAESVLSAAKTELSRRAVLIVLQHYEEIDSAEVFGWLLSLGKSKTVILSCKSPIGYQACWSMEVGIHPLDDKERERFLNECLQSAGKSVPSLSQEEQRKVFEATGGNPLRIQRAVSILQVGSIDDLRNPQFISNLVPDSFRMFSVESRKCLLALSLFPHGADTDSVAAVTRFDKRQIMDALCPLRGFVEVLRQTVGDTCRFSLSDRVTGGVIHELYRGTEDLRNLTNSWFAYFRKKALSVGFCWDDLQKLKALDVAGMRENIGYVLRQAMEDGRYDLAIAIGRDCRYWQYVRGDWLGEWSPVHTWLRASRAADNKKELFDALVYKLNVRSKQGMYSNKAIADATEVAKELVTLQGAANPTKVSLDRYQHALSLWDMACGRLREAEERWRACLRQRLAPHEKSAMQRHLAVCLRRQGKRTKARDVLLQQLKDVEGKYERSALMTHLNLVEMDLEDGSVESARDRLEAVAERIRELSDVSFLADWEYSMATCLVSSQDWTAAREGFERAKKHFEDLGKDRMVEGCDQMLNKLSMGL